MAGRPKSEHERETRNFRTSVKWSEADRERIARIRGKLGLRFDSDVVRYLTLEGLRRLEDTVEKNVEE